MRGRKHFRRGMGLVALAAAVGLAGATLPAASAATPKYGGTLNYGWGVGDSNSDLAPDSIPTASCCTVGTGAMERMAIYDALVVFNTAGDLSYRLAQSITSSDSVHWRLKLRPQMTFSDGTPFDAAAIKSTWDRWADPATKSPARTTLAAVATTSVVDAITLDITLAAPNRQFPRLVAQTVLGQIPSPTAVKTRGTSFGMNPVGAGPFMVKNYQRGYRLTMVRNPKYPLVKPYLDGINFRFMADEAQRYNTLKTGGIDVDYTFDWNTYALAKKQKMAISLTEPSGGQPLIFNTARKPFSDVRARRAIAYLFDTNQMIKDIFNGDADPAATLFKKESPLYNGIEQLKPDAAKAQKLIDDLGGLKFTMAYIPSGSIAAQAQWLQARVSAFDGAKMNITTIANALPLQQGNFDVTMIATPRFAEPYPVLDRAFGTGGSLNFGKYSNGAMDGALAQGRNASSLAGRKIAYKSVNSIFVDDVPMLFMMRTPNQEIYNSKVVGDVPVFNDGVPDWGRIWKR